MMPPRPIVDSPRAAAGSRTHHAGVTVVVGDADHPAR